MKDSYLVLALYIIRIGKSRIVESVGIQKAREVHKFPQNFSWGTKMEGDKALMEGCY
jgi:hypothetical protein